MRGLLVHTQAPFEPGPLADALATVRSWTGSFCLVLLCVVLAGCNDSLCDNVAGLPENASYGIVGDSVMDIFKEDICKHVAGRLSLLVGEQIPSFAESGATLFGGPVTEIPVQYENAREYAMENGTSIQTLIFDGGGNDLMWGGGLACTYLTPEDPPCEILFQECDEADLGEITAKCNCCDLIESVAVGWLAMVDKMRNVDNIDSIIYVGPYQLQGDFANRQEAIDRFVNRIRPPCQDYDVSYLDLEVLFEGHYSEYMAMDRLHPNEEGIRVISEALHSMLE